MNTQERTILNPFWDVVQTIPGDESTQKYDGIWKPQSYGRTDGQSRNKLARVYSWAIPDPDALAFVARHLTPQAVEIGAGTGYWAYLLTQMGVNMKCYDRDPPSISTQNHWHSPRKSSYGDLTGEIRDTFYDVHLGGAEKVAEHSERTLFLCWPPYDDSMASDTLSAYTGNKLVYIGEGDKGCTGNEQFHKLLGEQWEEVETHSIVQ